MREREETPPALGSERRDTAARKPRSGGPHSEMGKKRSSWNSLKHGYYAQQAVLPWEDREDYDRFVDVRLRYFGVEDPFEEDLVRRLADYHWKLRRIIAFETACARQRAVQEHVEPELADCIQEQRAILAVSPRRISTLIWVLSDINDKLMTANDELGFHRLAESFTVRLAVLSEIHHPLKRLREVAAADDFMGTPEAPDQLQLDDIFEHLASLQRGMLDFQNPSSDPAREVPAAELGKLCSMIDAVSRMLDRTINELKRILPIAQHRAELLEGTSEAFCSMPSEAEAKRLHRYRTSLEGSIRCVMTELEASRHLRNAGRRYREKTTG